MANATINALAAGAWAVREGESVEVMHATPNGLATYVLRNDQKRPAAIPTRWLTMPEPEPKCCPMCGRLILEAS